MAGIGEPGKTERMDNYIEKLEHQQGFLDNDWEEDDEEEVNATDTVFLDPNDGEEWLQLVSVFQVNFKLSLYNTSVIT